jgi:Ketopantoate reductase PanE/ApbA C terminal
MRIVVVGAGPIGGNIAEDGWETDDRRGPIRQLKQRVKTEVDQTFGHFISEGQRLKIPTPLCRSISLIIHEIEDGQRPLQIDNYGELIRLY